MKRLSIGIGISWLCVAAFLIAWPAYNAVKKSLPAYRGISSQTVTMSDFEFTKYLDNGAAKLYTLRGKRVDPETKRFGLFQISPLKIVRITDAEVVFYDRNTPVSVVKAKSAVIDAPSLRKRDSTAFLASDIEFSGNISVMAKDRRILTCDNLRWDNRQNRLLASGDCELARDGRRERADFIRTDTALTHYELKNDKRKRLKEFGRIFSMERIRI